MNEDIKEILNGLSKKASIYKMQINEGTSFNTDEYEANELLNYITNLQKENESLKRKLDCKERLTKIMPEDTEFIILTKSDYEKQESEIELIAFDYKQRNEKAIEYIKQHCDRPGRLLLPKIDFNYNELLNILQGGDEE